MKPSIIRSFIQSALAASAKQAILLEGKEAEQIRDVIEKKFARIAGSSPLWERLQDPAGRHRLDGWQKAAEFAGQQEVILFTDSAKDGMWQFGSGVDLQSVLLEAPGFEFYLTDPNPSYLLCHNHHDYLVGVGRCKRWLESIADD